MAKDFDGKADRLINLLDDFEKGKITSLEDISKKHPQIIKELWNKNFLESQKRYLKSLNIKAQNEYDRMADIEKKLKNTDAELKKIQSEAEIKLKELDNAAKNADASTKKKLQLEAKKIVDNYNQKAVVLEQHTWLQLTHMNPIETQRLSKIGVVDNFLKFNGTIDNFFKSKKTWAKVGKFMIGCSLLSLASDYAKWEKSWWQTTKEIWDIWAGMVPFAGWAYDLWTSITWKWFAWNLNTGDRVMRWVVWWASLILDVAWLFTFGAWNALSAWLKASVKWWTAVARAWKTISKAEKIGKGVVKWAEVVMTWTKVLWFGFLWYTFVMWAVPLVMEVDKILTPDVKLD